MQPRVGVRWKFCGAKFPKEEIIYFCQVLMVYIVVITSIVNLCISDKNTSEPSISNKKKNDVISYDSTIEQQHEDVPR